MGVAQVLVVGLAAYLLGSVPFAYVVAAARGVDLRKRGSGVASVANVGHTLGRGPAALALGGDLGKGLAPVALAARASGPELAAYVAVGIMIGHNWSPFLGFNGGRGVGIALVTAAILLPRELALLLIGLGPLALLLRDSAPAAGLGAVLAPVLAVLLQEPGGVVLGFTAMGLVILVRRLTAPPRTELRLAVLASRLVFDRPDPRQRWTLDPSGFDTGPAGRQ